MNLDHFIYKLEADCLYHLSKEYKDPKWKYLVFVNKDEGCGGYYEDEFNWWCEQNCENEYSVYNGCIVIFADEKDAMAFKLRWV